MTPVTAPTDPHARIAELEAELAALRREMQDFTCAMSHDLRAPLRHIVSFAKLVEEEAGPQLSVELQGFLGTVTGSAMQLGAMLDGLRELARLGMLTVVCQPVRLLELLEEVLAEDFVDFGHDILPQSIAATAAPTVAAA